MTLWVSFVGNRHRIPTILHEQTCSHYSTGAILLVLLQPKSALFFLANKMTIETKRKIVRLNVGGTHYEVSRDTLERCKGSMLASLISDHWNEGSLHDEPIFIDRNGRLFEYILDYLRMNQCHLPLSVKRAAVQEEFEYYGIDADMTQVMEKYSRAYVYNLQKRIHVKKSSFHTYLATADTNLVGLEKEVRAIQASAYLDQVSFRLLQLPAKVILPREYLPLDMDVLQQCLQLKGINVIRHWSADCVVIEEDTTI